VVRRRQVKILPLLLAAERPGQRTVVIEPKATREPITERMLAGFWPLKSQSKTRRGPCDHSDRQPELASPALSMFPLAILLGCVFLSVRR